MVKFLEDLKNVEFSGVRELAQAAEHVLRSTGTSQEKGTVAEFPNERTIRYYITEGLLDQAIKKRGVTSVFGYEHLLTLLAIKKLQADGLPISVIKNVLTDRSIEDLEKLIEEGTPTAGPDQDDLSQIAFCLADSDLDDEVPPPLMAMAVPPPEPPKPRNEAKDFLMSLLTGPERPRERQQRPQRQQDVPPLPRGTSDWRRYEIVPGLELNVSRSFRVSDDEAVRRRILVLIDGILQSRARR